MVDLEKKEDSSFTCAYVLTTSGRDHFAGMALISMMSLKASNPGQRVVLVCDSESYRNLMGVCHPLTQVCDQLVEVATPPGKPTFRNRWIKTQIHRFVDGDVLYLDSDTIIRGSLSDLPRLVKQFGGVANHNASVVEKQILRDDRNESVELGWECDYEIFVNGGVWFYKRSRTVEMLLNRWHELWMLGSAKTCRFLDQPSLNRAIRESGIGLTVLSSSYNAQVCKCWKYSRDAIIWHFYASGPPIETAFSRLLTLALKNRPKKLSKLVVKAAAMPAPWPSISLLGRWLAARIPPESRNLSIRSLLKEGDWFTGIGLIYLLRKWPRRIKFRTH